MPIPPRELFACLFLGDVRMLWLMDLRIDMKKRDAVPLRLGLCGRAGGLLLAAACEDDASAFIVDLAGLGIMDREECKI